ncbi:MAG: hypothetical protein VX777_00675 [Chlamydiota bacterium]|nr:hypothetical protein [Chlamydiota bacterium]
MYIYLWLPLYCAFVGVLSTLLPLIYFLYSESGIHYFRDGCARIFRDVNFAATAEKKLDNDVFDAEIEELLDQKLDDLVLVFKRQIPMAGTFLVGGLVEKLKKSAKAEILKMVPEIKNRLLTRMQNDLDSQMIVDIMIDRLKFKSLSYYLTLYCLAGAVIGFILGVMPIAFIHFLG